MPRKTPLAAPARLASCSPHAAPATEEQIAPRRAPSRAAESAFPVTIEHKYGSTTIEKAPERVVVVGLREQDALLALGVVPVATTEWYGEHPGAIFPWATDELGDAKPPTVLDDTDGVEIEKVAAQQPDLILGVYSGITEKEYDGALQARARRRPAQGQARLRHLVAGGDADHRQGGRQAGRGAEARRRHRAARSPTPPRSTRTSRARRRRSSPTTRASSSTARRTSARACSSSSA